MQAPRLRYAPVILRGFFGLFISLWDHLLGKFRSGVHTPRAGQIGVSDRPYYPRGYFRTLAEPIRQAV